jgi:hypothetical protein
VDLDRFSDGVCRIALLVVKAIPLEDEPQERPQAGVGAALKQCSPPYKFTKVCIDSGLELSNTNANIPPDPHGAAGLNLLIAVTNSQIEGIRKDGTNVFGPTDLGIMFIDFGPDNVFDPKIIFDVQSERFVMVALDRKEDAAGKVVKSYIYLAVSKNGDPTSTRADWHKFRFGSLMDNSFADYPGLAVDEKAVYITINMHNVTGPGNLVKSLLWIIPKSPFYEGQSLTVRPYDYIKGSGSSSARYGTHMPAMARSPIGILPPERLGTYLVKYDGRSTNRKESVQLVMIYDPLNSFVDPPSYPGARARIVNIGDIEKDPGKVLMGGSQLHVDNSVFPIKTGDRRALAAVWVNKYLWMTTTVGDGSQTAAYWLKFKTDELWSELMLVDKGKIDGEDIGGETSTAYASLDVNSKGIVAFGFSAFSPLIYASAYATMRDDSADPKGTVRAPDLVRQGENRYYVDFNLSRGNRWGDYTGLSIDPADPDCFWAFNEYAGNKTYTAAIGRTGRPQFGSWKTAWAKLCWTCANVGELCYRDSHCCAPADGRAVCSEKSCMICLNDGASCSRYSQCCNRACDEKKCKICRSKEKKCDRSSQCCPGLNCGRTWTSWRKRCR